MTNNEVNGIEASVLEKANQELSEKFAALPINLTVFNVAEFLGVSKTTAYNIVNDPEFPSVNIKGTTRKVIPKVKFIEWYLG